ncbi:MAG: hypothetical protein AAFY74_20575 [Pseudomonadota bacterium]
MKFRALPTTPINQLRQLIYAACGVLGYSRGYRARKLRKVCEWAKGLDLRRKDDVRWLAMRLGIIPSESDCRQLEAA